MSERGITGRHTYAEEGVYSGVVRYDDDCGEHEVAFTADVVDAPLNVSGEAVSGKARTPLNGRIAVFQDTDPKGTVSDYTATIAWGDEAESEGTVKSLGGASFEVTGSHTYAGAGTYEPIVTVRDRGGAEASESALAEIARTPTTVTTRLSGEGKTGESLSVKEGAPVTDQATLAGSNAASATGTVTYRVYADSSCEGPATEAGTVPVSAGKAASSSPRTLSPGTYYWRASYSGDEADEASTSACGTEKLVVEAPPKPTTLTTSLSGAGQQGSAITVPEGTAVQDRAALEGPNVPGATGTVKYTVYTDSSCTPPGKEAGEGPVSAGKAPPSSSLTLGAGVYHWKAEYSGDLDNLPSSSGCSEVLTVGAPPKVELAAPAASASLGSPVSVSATVTEAGAPRAEVPVTFTVTGANPRAGTVNTTANGQATFSYSGAQPGVDRVVASFVDTSGKTEVSNEVTVDWSSGPGAGTKNVLSETARHSPLPAPTLGRTVNVEPVSGHVFVKLPPPARGAAVVARLHKGAGFIPLTEARQVPVGSTLDTTEGAARVTSATSSVSASVQFGDFSAGVFEILQARKQHGLTELDIVNSESRRSLCATAGKRAALAARRRLSRRVLGTLRGEAHGRFRTHGELSSATVRGTIWSVTNRCDGTLTTVTRGIVSVRDFARRRTVTVRAGQSYLARRR